MSEKEKKIRKRTGKEAKGETVIIPFFSVGESSFRSFFLLENMRNETGK